MKKLKYKIILFFRKIKNYFLEKVIIRTRNIVRRFVRNIRRLRKYVPVIWKSYDFDYRYATDLFKMKLEDIATFLESDRALSVDASVYAQKIRTAIRLMDKVYSEEYMSEFYRILEEKYGKETFHVEFVETDDSNVFQMRWEYENWENANQIKKEFRDLYEVYTKKQEKAHRLLWEFIEHNIRHWWD